MNYASQAHTIVPDDRNTFYPFAQPIKKAVGFFGERISSILSKWFQPFTKKQSPSKNTFSGLFGSTPASTSEKGTQSFQTEVPIKQFKDTLENDLMPEQFKKAEFKLNSASFSLSWEARFYSYDGKYIDTFSKNTQVFTSVSKDVFYHEGKAFIYIDGHTHTSDRKATIESGYLRAVWLDTYLVQKEEKKASVSQTSSSIKSSVLPNTSMQTSAWREDKVYYNTQPRKNIFSWYMAPNGEEIPDYIIKAVTINYFGKIIQPKIEQTIKQTDEEIAKNREVLIKKTLETKKTAHTTVLQSQKEKISKKHKLTALSQAIQEAYWGKEEALENEDLKKIILSMQKKPEWQDIILKSYTVKKNMKKKKKAK